MNCRDVAKWLLAADSVAAVPEDLQGHLSGCARCRRRRQRLYRLHRAVVTLPLPRDNPAARARILDKIAGQAAVPQKNGVAPAVRRAGLWARSALTSPRRRWRTLLARAAMIFVVVGGIGWLTWYVRDPQLPSYSTVASDEDLLERLIEGHVHLAQGQPPEIRFQILAEMSTHMRREALRLAKADDAAEELPPLVELYTRVVQEGLVARAQKMDAHQIKALRIELRRTQVDVERAADVASPRVAEALYRLADAARKADQQLGALVEGSDP
jgi:hypothetical protein